MEHKLLKPHIRELVQSTRILLVVKYTCHNSTSWHRQTNQNRYRWGEEYTGRDGVGRGKARKDINSVLIIEILNFEKFSKDDYYSGKAEDN